MSENSLISWCHDSFNVWWGCQKVSPECKHCYAETLDKRFYGGGHWGPPSTTPRKLCSEKYWKNLEKWNKQASQSGQPRRVFVNSMSDIGELHPDVEKARLRLLLEILERRSLTFLLLTKRLGSLVPILHNFYGMAWPENLWLGTSVGARSRLPEVDVLRATPAAVKFISAEPLLEALGDVNLTGVDWLIVGGESGVGARTMNLLWAHQLKCQAKEQGVAFFFKQTGEVLSRIHGYKSRHGDDPAEWPEWLQVQEFPVSRNVAGA